MLLKSHFKMSWYRTQVYVYSEDSIIRNLSQEKTAWEKAECCSLLHYHSKVGICIPEFYKSRMHWWCKPSRTPTNLSSKTQGQHCPGLVMLCASVCMIFQWLLFQLKALQVGFSDTNSKLPIMKCYIGVLINKMMNPNNLQKINGPLFYE